MRIVVPHTAQYHPRARASHDQIEGLERVDVSGRSDAYLALLTGLWADRESFLIVEHDIEVTIHALVQARECECWRSSSPYNGPGLDPIIHALGFVRYRRELMEAEPDLMGQVAAMNDSLDIGPGHWRRLDARMDGALRIRGYEAHEHAPVLQHHVYYDPKAREDRCACLIIHPPYPVDREGRYLPKEV